MRKRSLVLFVCVAALAACSSGGDGFLWPPASGTIDLAAGDRDSDRVYIYYDILAGAAFGRQPDVILDQAGSGIDQPRSIDIANNRLFVANLEADTVTIWDDFLGLTNGQAPDVTLDSGGSLLDKPSDIRVHNNDLYVANQDSNEVFIFRDVSTLSDGDAPDVMLDSTGSLIDDPIGLEVTDDALYVTNNDNGTVTVYDDPGTLVTGQAPDVVLFVFEDPRRVFVFNNVLYVTTDDPQQGLLLAFSPANALTTFQAPDFRLGAPLKLVDDPMAVTEVAGRLFVSNKDDDVPGVIGFNNPATLTTSSEPSVLLPIPVVDVEELENAGGGLWGISDDFGFIWGYTNPSAIRTGDQPDITFFHPTMVQLKALRAVTR